MIDDRPGYISGNFNDCEDSGLQVLMKKISKGNIEFGVSRGKEFQKKS